MSITIYTDVDIDIDDIIGEIPLEKLKEEIQRRSGEPLKVPDNYTEAKMRNALAEWLNLREWEIKDEKVFMQKLKERLFP